MYIEIFWFIVFLPKYYINVLLKISQPIFQAFLQFTSIWPLKKKVMNELIYWVESIASFISWLQMYLKVLSFIVCKTLP